MTTKELFRQKIERRKGYISVTHFAEDLLSFLDTLPDEPVTDSHDLTEAAKKSAVQYYVDGGYSPFQNIETASHIAGFIAGAEWQKRKMMDGAVEGFVGVHLHDKRADVTVNSGYLPKEMGIKGDSKVKIIIVKEDKK